MLDNFLLQSGTVNGGLGSSRAGLGTSRGGLGASRGGLGTSVRSQTGATGNDSDPPSYSSGDSSSSSSISDTEYNFKGVCY
jgi:tuftelin-interacting protein 11